MIMTNELRWRESETAFERGLLIAWGAVALLGLALRLLYLDRAPLAASAGLAVADEPGVVVALAAAALAAAATWGWSPRVWIDAAAEARETEAWRSMVRPALLGASIAVVVVTGAAMDLSGLGFPLG